MSDVKESRKNGSGSNSHDVKKVNENNVNCLLAYTYNYLTIKKEK